MTNDDANRYFEVIEETFIALRGAPLLLSPKDWQLVDRWQRDGVPLGLVCSVLERLFESRARRGVKGRVNSLSYCANAVESAWSEVKEMTALGARAPAKPIAVGDRLRTLAASLPDGLPGPDWRSSIEDLAASAGEHEAERIERALAALDHDLIEACREQTGAVELGAIDGEVQRVLSGLAERVPEDDAADVRRRLVTEGLRRHWRLPVLSLFSPQARPPR